MLSTPVGSAFNNETFMLDTLNNAIRLISRSSTGVAATEYASLNPVTGMFEVTELEADTGKEVLFSLKTHANGFWVLGKGTTPLGKVSFDTKTFKWTGTASDSNGNYMLVGTELGLTLQVTRSYTVSQPLNISKLVDNARTPAAYKRAIDLAATGELPQYMLELITSNTLRLP